MPVILEMQCLISVYFPFVLYLSLWCHLLIKSLLSQKKGRGFLLLWVLTGFVWSRSVFFCMAPSGAQETLSGFCHCVAGAVHKFSFPFLLLSRGCLMLLCFPGCEDFWRHLQAENHQRAPGWHKSSPRYVSMQPLLEGQRDADYWLGDFCQGGLLLLIISSCC